MSDYIICYCEAGHNKWEGISGEDAMQIRVDELTRLLNCGADDILVFPNDSQI